MHFLWTNNDKRGFREAVFLFCCLVFLSIMYLDLNRIDVMLAFCTSCIRLKNFANSSSFQYVVHAFEKKTSAVFHFAVIWSGSHKWHFKAAMIFFPFHMKLLLAKSCYKRKVFSFYIVEKERPPKIWSLVEQKNSVPKCTHNALYYAMKKVQWSTRFSIKSKNINVIFVF